MGIPGGGTTGKLLAGVEKGHRLKRVCNADAVEATPVPDSVGVYNVPAVFVVPELDVLGIALLTCLHCLFSLSKG